MGNFFNNGPTVLKLIVRVRIHHVFNIHLENKLLNFFLKIYRSQTDYAYELTVVTLRHLTLDSKECSECKFSYNLVI